MVSLADYARLCGRTLARAHARSGDPALISGYLGKSNEMDEAVASFAIAYADQTIADHAALTGTRSGIDNKRAPAPLYGSTKKNAAPTTKQKGSRE